MRRISGFCIFVVIVLIPVICFSWGESKHSITELLIQRVYLDGTITAASMDYTQGGNGQSAAVMAGQGQLRDLSNPIAENSIVITDGTREGWEGITPYTVILWEMAGIPAVLTGLPSPWRTTTMSYTGGLK